MSRNLDLSPSLQVSCDITGITYGTFPYALLYTARHSVAIEIQRLNFSARGPMFPATRITFLCPKTPGLLLPIKFLRTSDLSLVSKIGQFKRLFFIHTKRFFLGEMSVFTFSGSRLQLHPAAANQPSQHRLPNRSWSAPQYIFRFPE